MNLDAIGVAIDDLRARKRIITQIDERPGLSALLV